jgi:hypothetical protein
MKTLNASNALIDGWRLNTNIWHYMIVCIIIAIVIRVLHCAIKAKALEGDKIYKALASRPYCKRFWFFFHGFKKHDLADHWLGAIISFSEISAYPVLIFTDNLVAIGAWLAIKTAVGFHSWQNNQLQFNRFLVSNIFNLAAAYFITLRYISPVKCIFFIGL